MDVRTDVLHADALRYGVQIDRNKENKVSNDLYPVIQYLLVFWCMVLMADEMRMRVVSAEWRV